MNDFCMKASISGCSCGHMSLFLRLDLDESTTNHANSLLIISIAGKKKSVLLLIYTNK